MDENSNADNWCSWIDGALTKDKYIDVIMEAGFTNVEVPYEKP
jgi:arsenite methyltransferase